MTTQDNDQLIYAELRVTGRDGRAIEIPIYADKSNVDRFGWSEVLCEATAGIPLFVGADFKSTTVIFKRDVTVRPYK